MKTVSENRAFGGVQGVYSHASAATGGETVSYTHLDVSKRQVQDAFDGNPDAQTAPLLDRVIKPVYGAYAALKQAKSARQPLDLDLPERKIVLDDDGRVTSVAFRDRFDAHKLIEEYMILANVAAAEELVRLKRPLLFRVHEEPSPQKLESLREVAEASGFTLAKGQVLRTAHLNKLLAQAQGTDFDELINISTLRSMTQAYYNAQNFGHFGGHIRCGNDSADLSARCGA